MKYCRLKQISVGVYGLPIETIFSDVRYAREQIENKRVSDMPAEWRANHGYRCFAEDRVDKNHVANAPVDADDGNTVSRRYPNATLRPDLALRERMSAVIESKFEEVAQGGFMFRGAPAPSSVGAQAAAALISMTLADGEQLPDGYKIRDLTAELIPVSAADFLEYRAAMGRHLMQSRNIANGLLDAVEAATGHAILDVNIEAAGWPVLEQ